MKTIFTIVCALGLLISLLVLPFQGKIADYMNKRHRGVSVIGGSDDDEE